ncbi:GNAT family N-acetyltransferase [Nocardia sp. NRRL S-836]|uniref:GNAT family N-acetyltransferase n=1 Tax=Nocardia sp. NRRL S-836 TaxID=1519492 RepID=UPI0006AE1AB8|nr:GNAT family N-acetyltransferase [Nocardia sp. NRRL S-836]
MTIRKAVLADAPAIAQVHVRSWQTTYRGHLPDSFLDSLSADSRTPIWERDIPSGNVWVALADDEVVGFAYAGPARDPDATSELYAIYLLASAQGTGLAHPLAVSALEGLTDTVLWVLAGNHRARRFYERLGFVLDGSTRQETIGSAVIEEVRYRRP